MFNLINIGERSGSGWKEPVIEERFDPDRTTLILEFINKTREENKRRK